MIVMLEFDARGSWRPRRNHVGALRRWICGPVAVAVLPGGFNDLMRALEEVAAEKVLAHVAERAVAARLTEGSEATTVAPVGHRAP